MNVFFVIQKPESIYDDQEGNCYDYKTSLPNGKQIQEGDWLILSLTNKTSKFGKKIIGIGQIETIDYRRVGQDTFATANYSRFKVCELQSQQKSCLFSIANKQGRRKAWATR